METWSEAVDATTCYLQSVSRLDVIMQFPLNAQPPDMGHKRVEFNKIYISPHKYLRADIHCKRAQRAHAVEDGWFDSSKWLAVKLMEWRKVMRKWRLWLKNTN